MNLQQAEQMLGRKYSITGRVGHGRKLGRTIGVPTANLFLKRRVSPVSGVFVVSILGIDDKVIMVLLILVVALLSRVKGNN